MPFPRTICVHCRLTIFSALLTGARAVRSPPSSIRQSPQLRTLTASTKRRRDANQTLSHNQEQKPWIPNDFSAEYNDESSEEHSQNEDSSALPRGVQLNDEQTATAARRYFGDHLPKGALSDEQYKIYERLYGPPSSSEPLHNEQESNGAAESTDDQVLLKEKTDGSWEQIEIIAEQDQLLEEEDFSKDDDAQDIARRPWTGADAKLQQDIALSLQQFDAQKNEVSIISPGSLDLVSEEYTKDEDIQGEIDGETGDTVRTHPFTLASRFGTSPSALPLPRAAMTGPISLLLSNLSNKHLDEAAHSIFGGFGLPYSPGTPLTSRTIPQKPIPLNAGQIKMTDMEADLYVAAVMPGTYTSVVSVITEIRKRLGTQWIEGLLKKEGGPKILDAGAAGAGVLAWREVLKAEWLRMHQNQTATSQYGNPSDTSAVSDQSSPVEMAPTPLGKATVLTGSDNLRHRASLLLENTTFLPRLPDYVHARFPSEDAQRKQFDIIIAPHSLWNMQHNYERKERILNLWSLLDPKGGVLVLLEKGVPRGFEVIAEARSYMLKNLFQRHDAQEELDSTTVKQDLESTFGATAAASMSFNAEPSAQNENDVLDTKFKDSRRAPARIIAPCPGHSKCPLYVQPGAARQRKDYCRFSQRYIRPAYHQRMLGAKGRNYEDVEFSYVAVQKGVEPTSLDDHSGRQATERAFAGYDMGDEDLTSPELLSQPLAGATQPGLPKASRPRTTNAHIPYALPRILKAPLKRKGHVHLDVCVPAGNLERWTVPRSFGKQAYRDARKARWGDLWALGAKHRDARRTRTGTVERDVDGAAIKRPTTTKVGPRGKPGTEDSSNVPFNAVKQEELDQDDEDEEALQGDAEVNGSQRKIIPKLRGRLKARTRRRHETRVLFNSCPTRRPRGDDEQEDDEEN